jgi:hydroxyacyl-ACP dehydratase HTD2-like protein with hotdog domain
MTGRLLTAEIGETLPDFTVEPTLVQVVMYAAAMWEFQRIHFDPGWAAQEGLPGPIVHGPLLGNYLTQAAASWAGPEGSIRTLRWRNRGIALVDEPLSCGGVVTGKRPIDGEVVIECDVWIDNPRGERLVIGSVTVEVASDGAAA